jgi:hypothetical protein
MDSMKAMIERLALMPTEQALGYPASMASPVKMGILRIYCTVTCKATGEKEKKGGISKVCVGSEPPTHLKRVTAKVGSRKNTCYRLVRAV